MKRLLQKLFFKMVPGPEPRKGVSHSVYPMQHPTYRLWIRETKQRYRGQLIAWPIIKVHYLQALINPAALKPFNILA
jgi:hypothetical protein